MKGIKFVIAAAVMAGTVSLTASAQKMSAAKVPSAVKTSFAKVFPGAAKVAWEKEKADYEAGFMKDGHEMSAVFKADGTHLETETEIKAAELPAPVMAYVKAHYKGAAVKESAKIVKASGEVNYEAEVKGKDLLFDSNGNFLKVAED